MHMSTRMRTNMCTLFITIVLMVGRAFYDYDYDYVDNYDLKQAMLLNSISCAWWAAGVRLLLPPVVLSLTGGVRRWTPR